MARKTKPAPRLNKTDTIIDNIGNWIEGSLDGAVDAIKSWKKTYKGYDKLWIETEYGYESNYLALKGERPETDQEYKARIENAKKIEDRNKEHELAEYERLKKKYERLKKKFD